MNPPPGEPRFNAFMTELRWGAVIWLAFILMSRC